MCAMGRQGLTLENADHLKGRLRGEYGGEPQWQIANLGTDVVGRCADLDK
ncbi:hypothetical protein GCM10027276_21880 [Comamonas piscis]